MIVHETPAERALRILPTAIAVAVLVTTGAWYLFSRLVWGPVPWPDGSAFFLPGLELAAWPVRWRMHAQAAFVPSYDQANFNLMPALPLLLGPVAKHLGIIRIFGAPLAIRVVSMAGLLLWAWVLWSWLREALRSRLGAGAALALASLVALAGLWDPINRWGTLVVRTEIWIGLAWVLILRELHRLSSGPGRASSKSLWKISAWLAVGAYFHFEAAFLVPATALGLFPVIPETDRGNSDRSSLREWARRLAGVTWRTLVFLSPWLIYALLNFSLFREQMDVQFHRLSHENRLIANPYLVFHSLFLSLGSPEFTPKLFNIAKAIFWGLIVFMTARQGSRLLLEFKRAIEEHRPLSGGFAKLVMKSSAALAFWTMFYLWCSKPEVWFITLCHLTLWPWLAIVLIDSTRLPAIPRGTRAYAALAGAYALFSLAAAISQQQRTPGYYSWSVYRAWVDCIESNLGRASGTRDMRPLRIWQPHVPDVLVELSQRSPNYDLTRALDFEARRAYAESFGRKADAILFTRWFNLSPNDPLFVPDGSHIRSYEGPERPADTEKMREEVEVPFGPWALEQLPKLEPGAYLTQVCQVGPFWADLRIRVGP